MPAPEDICKSIKDQISNGSNSLVMPMQSVDDVFDMKLNTREGSDVAVATTDSSVATTANHTTVSSALARARMIANPNNITHNPSLQVFNVKGDSGSVYMVKLYPRPTCTCKSDSNCYHILAVQLSIGTVQAVFEFHKFSIYS